MTYQVSERFAFNSSVVTNVALLLAIVCIFAFEWLYLLYLLFVFVPTAFVVLANYWLIQPPNGWLRTFPRPYTVLSIVLIVMWLAASGVGALLIPWVGH